MKKDAQTYIENKLQEFYSKFNGIKIRYEYDVQMKLHLVEILPQNIYDENQTYVLAEMEMEDEFEVLYGDKEEILFVSKDSLNKIENPSFQLGYTYIDIKINLSDILNDIFEGISFEFSEPSSKLNEESIKISDKESYALAA